VVQLISYAEEAGIPVPSTKRGEPPFSMDANLLHISYEGNALEDPWQEPDESMFTRSVSPEDVSEGGGGAGLEGGWRWLSVLWGHKGVRGQCSCTRMQRGCAGD
jgi:hypothetical protein